MADTEQYVVSDMANFENTKWFLEGLCRQYKAAFDSLKQVLSFCQCKLSGSQMEHFQYEINYVEGNITQLEVHYSRSDYRLQP